MKMLMRACSNFQIKNGGQLTPIDQHPLHSVSHRSNEPHRRHYFSGGA